MDISVTSKRSDGIKRRENLPCVVHCLVGVSSRNEEIIFLFHSSLFDYIYKFVYVDKKRFTR